MMINVRKLSGLVIVRGIPGSGKSTFAKRLVEAKRLYDSADYYEADMFFERNGEYKFDPKHIGAAHNWCMTHTAKSMYHFRNNLTVVSNTFTQWWEMKDYVEFAECDGLSVTIFRMTNEYQNIHGVPDNVIEKMKNRFENIPEEIFIGNEYQFIA